MHGTIMQGGRGEVTAYGTAIHGKIIRKQTAREEGGRRPETERNCATIATLEGVAKIGGYAQ